MRPWGAVLRVLDSVTEGVHHPAGAVLVTGSHGGLSAGRYALQSRPLLVVFNDAGIGKDGAGIASLALLQAQGIAACAVSHDSARIGEAASTLEHGVLSCANEAAQALGARPGLGLKAWLAHSHATAAGPAPAGATTAPASAPSPARR